MAEPTITGAIYFDDNFPFTLHNCPIKVNYLVGYARGDTKGRFGDGQVFNSSQVMAFRIWRGNVYAITYFSYYLLPRVTEAQVTEIGSKFNVIVKRSGG